MILLALLLSMFFLYITLEQHLTLHNNLLKISLSFLLTISLFSFVFCLFLFVGINFTLFQLTFIIAPLTLLIIQRHNAKIALINLFSRRNFPSFFTSLIVLLCIYLFTFLFFTYTFRWGNWDAIAIWNLHAKFLTYNSDYINLFTNKIEWTHPDYPLMLSSIIAIAWKSLGVNSPLITALISYVIGLSMILLILSSFYEKKLKLYGIIIFIILTCTGVLFPFVSSQYADTLFALFILIPFILLNHLDKKKPLPYIFLIGFFVTSTTWIKNEGVAFFLIFSFYFILKYYKKTDSLKYFLFGAILPLLVLIIFKLNFAPVNDLISGQSNNSISKILDIHRYLTIFNFSIPYFFNHFQIFYILLVLVSVINYKYYFTFNFRIILTLLATYFLVYVLTPRDLIWHLSTSLDRLLYHVFPAFIYTIFIYIDKNFSTFQQRL